VCAVERLALRDSTASAILNRRPDEIDGQRQEPVLESIVDKHLDEYAERAIAVGKSLPAVKNRKSADWAEVAANAVIRDLEERDELGSSVAEILDDTDATCELVESLAAIIRHARDANPT
jgi:DNA-binding ferritin-like protein